MRDISPTTAPAFTRNTSRWRSIETEEEEEEEGEGEGEEG
jgi:hypothetical protein